MKNIIFLIFILCCSCETSTNQNSFRAPLEEDGMLEVHGEEYKIDDHVSSVTSVTYQECHEFLLSLELKIYKEGDESTPYRLFFGIPFDKLGENKSYEFHSEQAYACSDDTVFQQSYMWKIVETSKNLFYNSEPSGIILHDPSGTIVLHLYESESTEAEDWINYKIEFDLIFSTTQNQRIPMTGHSLKKLFYRYAGSNF